MQTVVIGPGQYGELKRKALKESLLKKYEDKLSSASKSERQQILAAIDAEVDATAAEDLKNWRPAAGDKLADSRLKISGFKAALIILTVIAVFAVGLWLAGARL